MGLRMLSHCLDDGGSNFDYVLAHEHPEIAALIVESTELGTYSFITRSSLSEDWTIRSRSAAWEEGWDHTILPESRLKLLRVSIVSSTLIINWRTKLLIGSYGVFTKVCEAECCSRPLESEYFDLPAVYYA